MTIGCKRSFMEMTYDKPNYASFGPFYLVDCLNYTAEKLDFLLMKIISICCFQHVTINPLGDAGVLRIRPPYPKRVVKGEQMGRCVGITV